MNKENWKKVVAILLPVLLVMAMPLFASDNVILNADLETDAPFAWSPYPAADAELIWAEDEAYTYFRSFKIAKTSTGTEKGWLSENFAQRYWNNMQGAVLYSIGAHVKTEGVNTGPTSDAEKFQLVYSFYSEGILLASEAIDVPQTAASTTWTEITSAVTMASDPDSAACFFRAGASATGTVWVDDISLGSSPWTAGMFGGNAETPASWMMWTAGADAGRALYATDSTHSGTHSAKLIEEDTNDDEIVFYSIPAAVEGGETYMVSYWAKTEDVTSNEHYLPSNMVTTRDNDRLGLCFFGHKDPMGTSWNLTDPGDLYFYANQVDSTTDWTQYAVVWTAPDDATGVSVRARYTSFVTGTAWFDDFAVEKIDTWDDNVILNADLETDAPFAWSPYPAADAELIWAEDEAYTYFRSFKIAKTSTGTEKGWLSENFAQRYWNNMQGAVLYSIGAHVKTEGVNTGPTSDAEKFQLVYSFYSEGILLASEAIDVPQTAASTTWTEITSAVTMASDPDSAACFFRAGASATGTVWVDDISLGSSPWTAGMFGGNAETPASWMMWTAGADAGRALYATDSTHSGTHSAKLIEEDTNDDEIVFYSIPAAVEGGETYMVSYWAKTEDVTSNEHYLPSNMVTTRDNDRLGLCFFGHKDPMGTSWNLTDPGDLYFYANQVDSTTDWTEYRVIWRAPDDAVGVSVRARYTSFVTGTTWFDDFSVCKVTGVLPLGIDDRPAARRDIPEAYQLSQNYPNPFNPETIIGYNLPRDGVITLAVYNIMGQRVAKLVDGFVPMGEHNVKWFGKTDSGNPVSSGVYFYRLTTENYSITKKMLLIR